MFVVVRVIVIVKCTAIVTVLVFGIRRVVVRNVVVAVVIIIAVVIVIIKLIAIFIRIVIVIAIGVGHRTL